MKKNCTLLLAAILCGWLFTACNNKPSTTENAVPGPGGSNGGIYYNDSVLDNYVWRVFKNSNGHFLVPYNANITVDTNTVPYTLSTLGQAGSFTAINSVTIKNSAGGNQVTSNNGTIGSDTTRQITYLGPFDPVGGHFYTSNGRLHYVYSTSKDSILCYISRVIWWGQSGNGGGIAIGFITQADVQN